MHGYKKVGAWRLVERTMVAWCEMTRRASAGSARRRRDDLEDHLHRASRRETMARTSSPRARSTPRSAAKPRERPRAPRATLFRVARLQRGRRSQQPEIVRERKKNASPRPYCCGSRRLAAVADAARDADATDRAVRHAVRRLLWRVRLEQSRRGVRSRTTRRSRRTSGAL